MENNCEFIEALKQSIQRQVNLGLLDKGIISDEVYKNVNIMERRNQQ